VNAWRFPFPLSDLRSTLEVISDVYGNVELVRNDMGNLVVVDRTEGGDDSDDWKLIGWIDLATGAFEVFP
jgi:hypothetical protein